MENDTESGKLIKNLEEVELNQEDIRIIKKIIQKSEQNNEFPKTFIKKFKTFMLLGILMAILLFLVSVVAKNFSFIYGIGFFILSVTIFRIVAIEWQNDLLLTSYKFCSSSILSFIAVIFLYDSIGYGLDKMSIWLLLLAFSIYVLISWIDEVYKKFKINMNKKSIDRKFTVLVVSLPLIFFILYEYMPQIFILFDAHPWLATVIMVALSVLTTYVLARRKEIKGRN